jgi:hypothetical protein
VAAVAAVKTRVPGPRRGALRSVSAEAGPVVQLELGSPLQLTATMRARLLGAVRALVKDPALEEASDGARLASVVLTAKATIRDGYRTSIWAKELGRWLGVSQSTVAHTVLPELRRAGMLGSKAATNTYGHATGLECWVVPMYRAQQAGDRRHALALSRAELAVLLRLCEVLFGPGWAPKDREPIPAGLLAGRTGRGAATDRLGLLLMVLSTGSAGWLQLCPGTVDTDRGRPAATVARLLGCSPAGGGKVLKRLQKYGVADVVRQETGSGLNGRSRVRLVPVAEAHGRVIREARQATEAVFSDLAATAFGDHEIGGDTETLVNAGVSGAAESETAGSADLAASAHHHALHASVVTQVSSAAGDLGFSGEGRGGEGRLPDRAGAREDQAVDSDAAARLTLLGGAGGPLRGDKPKKSPVVEGGKGGERQSAAGQAAPVGTSGQSRQQRGRVPLPPVDLLTVLAPVQLLWARLDRPFARRLVEGAVRTELASVAGFAGRADAGEVLADRLARRLASQGGTAAVTDPVGWLIGRGLPQRAGCADVRCDEGLRLDTGGECATCEYVVNDRRAKRHQVAAAVDAEMPHASEAERRTAVEQQLHEAVTSEGWTKALRREQLEAERAARRAAAAQARAEAEAAAVAPVAAPEPEPLPVVVLPAPRPVGDPEPEDDDQAPIVLEELTREQIIDLRMRAQQDHQRVLDHIEEYGELFARRLYTSEFVDQVKRLAGTSHLVLAHTTWGQA